MESLNRLAIERVDEALEFAQEFGIGAHELDGGATVLDFGVEFDGGIEAGLLLVDIQTTGLATVDTRMDTVDGAPVPHVQLQTDHPALSLLCSQKAGWQMSLDGTEWLGSGPARALVAEEDVFADVDYVDAFDLTTLAVECDTLPGDTVAAHVADRAGVEETGVHLLAFSSASVAGSVSVAARASETAVYRLFELGYDPTDIVSASGSAPMAPVAGDERSAMVRTNDALAYGGQVHLVVDEEFDRFDEVVSAASEDHGRTFREVFDEADWEFDQVPRAAFAPAQVTVDVVGGPTHVYGETDESVVAESFGL